ncbi:MAG: glycosyltransferase [Paludibacteraceae bacterium]|nr:glycosyltransferase [Paludibacteraceae bacterium]
MKPRILIAMHYMELGGAESALLGLLQAHDSEKADIDLFLYDHVGELMQYIPDSVNILPKIEAYSMLERPISELLRKGYWGVALSRALARYFARQEKKNNKEKLDDISVYYYISKLVNPFLPKINPSVEYDLAISFLQPHLYVLKKVRARKKLAWLHTDYSKVFVSQKEEAVWSKFNYIAAISEDVGHSFVNRFPSLNSKIIPVENILSSKFIRERAMENDVSLPGNSIRLLTIGRYSYPKKLEDIPVLTASLQKIFPDLKWYIIGYGNPNEEKKIFDSINLAGVKDNVVLLGKKTNPYPYIKACDIYVQPSRYEGKSITVREAQILCKPVIVTAYPTATSQIRDGVDGVIVPLEIEQCANAMISFLKDKEKQEKIIYYLSAHDFGNEIEINKIYQLAR